jgi:hypothetical protein
VITGASAASRKVVQTLVRAKVTVTTVPFT